MIKVFQLLISKSKDCDSFLKNHLSGFSLLELAKKNGLKYNSSETINLMISPEIESVTPIEYQITPDELEKYPVLKECFSNRNSFQIELSGKDILSMSVMELQVDNTITVKLTDSCKIVELCERVLQRDKK